jgi:sortase A
MTPTRLRAAVLLTAAVFSLLAAVQAAWIPVKAELAQWLIERSWRQAATGAVPPPPWPWADTRPAAVLEAPGHGIRLFVLQGSSGRNLAFGPTRLDASTGSRDVVISGHRDTHFRFLEQLRAGDRLRLTDRDGSREYAVRELEVVDSREQLIVIEHSIERLTLVTCYPFDSPTAGGALRFVVTAYPLSRR